VDKDSKKRKELAFVRVAALRGCFVLLIFALAAGFCPADDTESAKASAQSAAAEFPESKGVEETPAKLYAPVPDSEILEGVRDGTRWQAVDPRDPDPTAKAYYHLVILAHTTSPEAFANSVRRGVSYANLFHEPWKYRGEVIHYEGELTLLRPNGTPRFLEGDGFDIQNVYEGWIFNTELNYDNPVCVAFTELPAGLKPSDRISVLVSVDGYFFKKLRYEDGARQTRDAPLLISRTIQIRKAPARTDSGWQVAKYFGGTFLGVLGLLVVLTIALNWWYRQGDRRIHAALAAAKTVEFENMEPEATAEVPSAAPRNRLEDFRPRGPI
jgi:hypothetical protein